MTTKTIYTTFPEYGFARARFSCDPKDLDDYPHPRRDRYKSRTVVVNYGSYFPSCAGPGGDGFRLRILGRDGQVASEFTLDSVWDAESLMNWLVDE